MNNENEIDQETNGEIEKNSHPSLTMILETSNNSTIERHVKNVLRKHFLERKPMTWKPIKVELVVNTKLTDEFFVIRKKFEKASAGNQCEFDEHYAFLIENDRQIHDICENGYYCTETSFNVLGHSKGGVYVCKYADVCIRQASVRRTWGGSVTIKMIVFKIVEGKQTAALVRKGPKLQPIAPTPLFTTHSSVITPKETDDLEKQFDQSQIFLYEFEGRETVKRPHHCLPYAIVSLIQDGSQWPKNFDDLVTESDILETDTLRVIAQSDDPLLQNKLKENVELAEAATRALEHIYEVELPPPPPPPPETELPLSPSTNSETIPTTTTSDNISVHVVNGTEPSSSSPTTSNDNLSSTSPPPTVSSVNDSETSLNSTAPPPPSSTDETTPPSKAPVTVAATTIPLPHSTAAVQAAYRQQTSLLGALPTAAALRAQSGAMYATTAGLANGLTGQILYGGIPMDALRGYQTTGGSPYVFATHGGQAMQQSALYAAQLQAVAQQQQAAQFAAVAQQQQQQQSLINGIPPGYMLVRTSNGGYALLAQSQAASATAIQAQAQAQAQAQLAQQQYISFNGAGQPTAATAARLPAGMVGGQQQQQVVYQYAGQPTIQAAPTQYIQLPANYAQQQQQQLSTSPGMQTTSSGVSQAYTSQPATQYIGALQPSNNNNSNGSLSNSSSGISSSPAVTSATQSQPTSTLISPQKQSAASATAAAIQQQQQYQHSYQSQQQPANGTHGANVYYAAIAQAQAQLTAQVQAQQQATAVAALAQQQQQQQQQQLQQQQLNFISQMQYASQQGVPQQMYYAAPGGQTIYQAGGQSYILAQAAPTAGTTTTGSPAMYSAGPALHNGASQSQTQQHASQSQQQIAYQIAAATGQPTTAAYQMVSAASNPNIVAQQQSTAGAGVVAQQPAQLAQRSNVIPQVRHHPYRN